MKHYNLNSLIPKTTRNKSAAENILSDILKNAFPLLKVSQNDRAILPSKIELDLYFPDLKFAIELNGPVHYFPIYGDERLSKVKTKDTAKQRECQDLNITLISLDISKLQTQKTTIKFLTEQFHTYIQPIIQALLVALAESNGI